MAVRGTKLKPPGQSRTRHKPTHDWVEVPNVPFVGGLKLPRRKGGWPALTKRWWEVISSMPHCVLWSVADWQFAADTALVAAEFHEGTTRAATELRQREKLLGVTMDARRDLRIRYVDATGEVDDSDAEVTRLADFRDL